MAPSISRPAAVTTTGIPRCRRCSPAPDEEGYGDYIIMRIDETGRIADWNPKDVEKWVKEQAK